MIALIGIIMGMFIVSRIIETITRNVEKNIGTKKEVSGQYWDNPIKMCPPHKYVHGQDGNLICSECNFTPGSLR
jgi:hypothetical protein